MKNIWGETTREEMVLGAKQQGCWGKTTRFEIRGEKTRGDMTSRAGPRDFVAGGALKDGLEPSDESREGGGYEPFLLGGSGGLPGKFFQNLCI